MSTRLVLALGVLLASLASAAALVPVPTPKVPLPVAGIEVNQGQAKPEILFLGRGTSQSAVTAQSVLFSPSGVRQTLVGGNLNPVVRYTDALPGVANVFTGSDASKWVTGIKRYSTARLVEVYTGIDVEYAVGVDGQIKMRLLVRAGANLSAVTFALERGSGGAPRLEDGVLSFPISGTKGGPTISYTGLGAVEETPVGPLTRSARFELQSPSWFGVRVDGTGLATTIEMKITVSGTTPAANPQFAADATGNTFAALTASDWAGKGARFPNISAEACSDQITSTYACSDVAIYKLAASGAMVYVSYLAGRTAEEVKFLGLAENGDLVVSGNTDSNDFPVTAGAFQSVNAGPAAIPSSASRGPQGDFFVARLDSATGELRASTYFGGPNADQIGQTALAPDGSVYFLPEFLNKTSENMPVVSGAAKAVCGNPCSNGYAAHLDAGLAKLFYGTYLPGNVQASARLHADGSVYFAGSAGAGFATTPGAYKPEVSGEEDGILARLNPSGTALLFATYIGGPLRDWILRMAVASDGSAWVGVSSFADCCVGTKFTLVHLDSLGTRIIAERDIVVNDLGADREGNVLVLTETDIVPSAEAFLSSKCRSLAYVKLNSAGQQLFGTFLPASLSGAFQGVGPHGLPLMNVGGQFVEIVEGTSMGVYAGCMLDAGQFENSQQVNPGEIVTLFGSNLGPREGVAFQLVNGRLPNVLGGTRVLVNGAAVPILYSSYGQVNAILPYSLLFDHPEIRVDVNGVAGNIVNDPFVRPASGPSVFTTGQVALNGSNYGRAAALNEDGSVNSAANPAKKGSRVVLFGTGGGQTFPASEAGEVTAQARPLAVKVKAWIHHFSDQTPLAVEYAGAAPTLVAGVVQINIKLPDVIPSTNGLPPGLVLIRLESEGSGSLASPTVISVAP